MVKVTGWLPDVINELIQSFEFFTLRFEQNNFFVFAYHFFSTNNSYQQANSLHRHKCPHTILKIVQKMAHSPFITTTHNITTI